MTASRTVERFTATLVLLAPALLAAQGSGRTMEVPATHRPPPGMCRIWVDGVPTSKQPAPTDCATALRNKPANGTVIFGEPRAAPARGSVGLPREPGRGTPVPTIMPGRTPPIVDSVRKKADTTRARRDTTGT